MTCMSSCQTGTCTHTMYLCVARNCSFPTCLCRSNQEVHVVFGIYPLVLFSVMPCGFDRNHISDLLQVIE